MMDHRKFWEIIFAIEPPKTRETFKISDVNNLGRVLLFHLWIPENPSSQEIFAEIDGKAKHSVFTATGMAG
jgi:hypothetical protein